jgi:hypothetical protein
MPLKSPVAMHSGRWFGFAQAAAKIPPRPAFPDGDLLPPARTAMYDLAP